MTTDDWHHHAPCTGDARFWFRDVQLVPDGVNPTLTEDELRTLAEPLLKVCAQCPFRALCVRRVCPAQGRYDGVCGGHVWMAGVVITPADTRDLPEEPRHSWCGTTAGPRYHRDDDTDEESCRICLGTERDRSMGPRGLPVPV